MRDPRYEELRTIIASRPDRCWWRDPRSIDEQNRTARRERLAEEGLLQDVSDRSTPSVER